jgi:hypothetical protein
LDSHIATQAGEARARHSLRSLTVLSLGPLTVLGGIVWALLQPYRLTLLDPHGQGFWWLVSQPPLYVIAVGVLFHFLVAPQLVEDLEEAEA